MLPDMTSFKRGHGPAVWLSAGLSQSVRHLVPSMARPWSLWFLPLLSVISSCASTATDLQLERSLCGFKEPAVFWLWSKAAGRPDASRISDIENLEEIAITSKDRRTLRGYKLKAHSLEDRTAAAKGYLLIAQGNAMLADQIIGSFQDYASAGYDVYLFDYRGYGRSAGKRRLKAILSDYDEIIDHLDSLPYSRRLFYGMSFGGIVLLDALQGRLRPARLVIDSTPSRLSDYGCPETHDPLNNLPEDCSRLMLLVGGKDRVVTPSMSKALVDEARRRGATLLQDPELGHPFMDSKQRLHRQRMHAVRSFLLE